MHRSKYAMRFLISLGTKKQPTPAHPESAVYFFQTEYISTFIALIGHQSDLV